MDLHQELQSLPRLFDSAETAQRQRQNKCGCGAERTQIAWPRSQPEWMCLSCMAPELAVYSQVFESGPGKKVLDSLKQRLVVQPTGVPKQEEVMFHEGARSVYWMIVRFLEIAKKLKGRNAGE